MAPVFLAGALLVALPIALHLAMRQQARRLEFPALRFVQMRQNSNRRQLRLRQLLLLFLRCATIGLLAFALARPSIRGSGMLGGQESPVGAAFLFDTTPRMDYWHKNQTRLQVAQDIALWILERLPSASEVAILDARSISPAFAVDRGVASRQIERLHVTTTGQSLSQRIEDAIRLVKKSDRPCKEVYVLTDLARASWTKGGMQWSEDLLAKEEDIAIYVIDVGVERPQNSSLGEVRLSAERLARNDALQIETDVRHTGSPSRRVVDLFLLDENGLPQKRGRIVHAWREGKSEVLKFPPLQGLAEGYHQGWLQIVGEDGLSWDDKRYFTVEVKPAWKVLVAASDPVDAFHLVEALSPESFRRNGCARFECQVVSWGDLATENLCDYAVVCLMDPSPLPSAVWEALATYARSGHSVAIFLGSKATPAAAFDGLAPQQLFPGNLKRQWREPTKLVLNTLQHPMLLKFRPRQGQIPWASFPVYQYWQLELQEEGINVILRYATNHPAVLEKPLGRGNVLTMTTPISHRNIPGRKPWNLLATGTNPWPFLILSNEMMLYLVGGEVRWNVLAGETMTINLENNPWVPLFSLETPRGEKFKQAVRPDQHSLVVTNTDDVGNYRARAGGLEGGLDRGFSVNLPSSRTELQRLSNEELLGMFRGSNVQIAHDRDEISRRVNVGRQGRELYPYTVLLLAVVLGFEHILSNRFYVKGQ